VRRRLDCRRRIRCAALERGVRGDVRPQRLSNFSRNGTVADLSEPANLSGQLGLDVPDHADLDRSVRFSHALLIG
jgi:hypothetical protein